MAELICDTSQMKTLGAACCRDLHADEGLAPMSFTNNGRACDLYGDMSAVQAVAGPERTPVDVGTLNDDVARLPMLVEDGQSSPPMLSVALSWTARCRPATTDGLVISDGRPLGSTVYVHYVLRRICAGSAFANLNAGIVNSATG